MILDVLAQGTRPRNLWISPTAGIRKKNGQITERWWASMRPCPKCKTLLSTEGSGHFRCRKCEFSDTQKLSRRRGRPRKEAI